MAEHRGRHFIYAQTKDTIDRRQVEVGASNNRMIVVKSGVTEGDVVVLDARSRAAKEFEGDDDAENEDVTKLATDAPGAESKPDPVNEKSATAVTTPTEQTTPVEVTAQPAEALVKQAEASDVKPVEPNDATSRRIDS